MEPLNLFEETSRAYSDLMDIRRVIACSLRVHIAAGQAPGLELKSLLKAEERCNEKFQSLYWQLQQAQAADSMRYAQPMREREPKE